MIHVIGYHAGIARYLRDAKQDELLFFWEDAAAAVSSIVDGDFLLLVPAGGMRRTIRDLNIFSGKLVTVFMPGENVLHQFTPPMVAGACRLAKIHRIENKKKLEGQEQAIKEMIQRGMTINQMRLALGVHHKTLSNFIEDNEEFLSPNRHPTTRP